MDFAIQQFGTLCLITPGNSAAYEWVDENVQLDPWQWLAGSFVIETRFVEALAQGTH